MLSRKKATPAEAAAPTPVTSTSRRMNLGPRGTEEILAKAAARKAQPVTVDSAAEQEALVVRVKENVEAQLKLISEADTAIDTAVATREQALKVIEAQLKLGKLDFHTDGSYLAEIVDQWTKQSRDIDPQKFRAKVSNEVFWSSIKVSVTLAEKHLTDKELGEIADVVPGKLVGQVLKVRKLGPKTRAKKE